ncbi:hypothetical protein Belba_0393 [Belliella baltica DSM 15883]|uniref:Uncharacterized protein n=1 Tax=Belliella baltica (strain DSM 15883 / CIP 108006 / LMG 21964 / BA134) TaxID=866536 RepID=I3Z1D6_BELBD|nr:hypothetical protein [Belliella baltica]AFL83054.1 hypothetical protein Belba_0393 [Belliella baltica DSM 15883]
MPSFKQILIAILIIAFAIGGYFFYNSTLWNGEKNALEVVSEDAIFVFETEEPVMAWNQLVSQPIWTRLTEIPSVKNAERQLVSLDSLVGRSGNLDRSLKGNQLVVSLHPVGKEEFDFLFTLSFKNGSDQSFIESLEKNLPELSQITTRNYSAVPIYEFQSVNLNRILSYAKIGNIIVASYTSFLVEEAIRLFQNSSEENFKSANQELFKSLRKPSGLGVFRLSSKGLSKFFAGISRDENLNLIQQFSKNEISGNFEIFFSEGKFSLLGNTFFKNGEKYNFTPGDSDYKKLINFIPNRTAVLFQYNLRDSNMLGMLNNENFQGKATVNGEIEIKLLQKDFFKKLSGEMTFMIFETIANQDEDRILLIKTEELATQIDLLKEFNKGADSFSDGVIPIDYYQEKEIFVLNLEDFPAHLFNGKFLGFPQTYITSIDEMLVFANSSKSMKIFLDDINADNTWGKSLTQKRLSASLSENSGFNFVVNVPRIWNSLEEMSSPNWRVFFQKYAPQLRSLDILTLGIGDTEKENQTKIDILYSENPINAVSSVTLTENRVVQFRDNLIYGPQSIQNFNDRSFEFVVQDELNQVHLLSGEGEIVFSQTLEGSIISDIFQVDYYKNGKLQLLFATESRIYIIDRLGSFVSGYPLEIPDRKITHLNLVDYDDNRDYRFFVGTDQAELYILNKNGDVLDGWDPKRIESNLAVKPAHHRVAGVGDQMLALTENGRLYFFNRRGEAMLDSPIKLGDKQNSDYIIIERGSASSSRVVTVTQSGEIVNVNFQGEIAYRNQLMRPDPESQFFLIKDQKDDRFIYVVHEYNKITAMDSEYNVLFDYNIYAENLKFQLFSFGGDKNILVIVDPIQEFTYLFNLKGQLLNTLPISSKNKVEIKYSNSKNEYSVFATSANTFIEYKLPL